MNTSIVGLASTANAVSEHDQTVIGFTGTLISINTNPGAFYGSHRGPNDRAATIVHELGHALFRLSGGTGYIQPNDIDPGANERNTRIVNEVCRF
jgi:hypothetical protein